MFNLSDKVYFLLTFLLCFINIINTERGVEIGCYKKIPNDNLLELHIYAGSVDICLDACEKDYFLYSVLFDITCFCTNNLPNINELNSSDCNTYCKKNEKQICGGENALSYYSIDLKEPGPPKNVHVTGKITETSIKIAWEAAELTKFVQKYLVRAVPVETYAKEKLMPVTLTYENDTIQAELLSLYPGTKYEITVISLGKEEGGNMSIIAETEIGLPNPEPIEPKVISQTDTTRTIEIYPSLNYHGPINFYQVVVLIIDDTILQTFNEKLVSNYNNSIEAGLPYYITAELDIQNRTRTFTVGDGRTYRSFYNKPLTKDQHIHISVGLVSMHNNVTKIRYANATHNQHDSVESIIKSKINISEDNSGLIIFLIVACVVFGIILILMVIAYIYIRINIGNRRRLSDHHELALQGPIVEVENNGYIPDEYERGNFKDQLNTIVKKLSPNLLLPRNALNLEINNFIGTGCYGDVIYGNLKRTNGQQLHRSQVHVISDDMERQHQITFLSELDQLTKLPQHYNLLEFYGLCQTPDWFYIVYEDLKITLKYKLLESRQTTDNNLIGNDINTIRKFSTLNEWEILKYCSDIADAMDYLSSLKFIHKRLCSYNVYITALNDIKITTFGPAFDGDGRTIDLSRWQAPEVLKFQHHTPKSDVWAFGCLIWECCALGGTLYNNISQGDLFQRIRSGIRPEKLNHVFIDLYQLLINCWDLDANERPTFSELTITLRNLMQAPQHTLSFEMKAVGNVPMLPDYLPLLEIDR